MSDAAAGGTEWKQILQALELLYAYNLIERPQYASLVADVVSTALQYDSMSVADGMQILKDAGLME